MGLNRSKTRDEKELLVAQQSAKQLMLSEYEKGPNCEECAIWSGLEKMPSCLWWSCIYA